MRWLKEYKPILPLGSAWVAARSSNEKAKEGRTLMFRLRLLENFTAVSQILRPYFQIY